MDNTGDNVETKFNKAVCTFGRKTAFLIYWKELDSVRKNNAELDELLYLLNDTPNDSPEEKEVLALIRQKIKSFNFEEKTSLLKYNFKQSKKIKLLLLIKEEAKTIKELTQVWFWKTFSFF